MIYTYCAFDLLKRKQYYGSTSNFKRRISSHLKDKGEGNKLFHNVLRKRPDTFFWVQLCISESREEEQYLLDFYCPSKWVYNVSKLASGFSLKNEFAGRNKGKVTIHFLDKKQTYVDLYKLDDYLCQGWDLGVMKKYKEKYRKSHREESKQKISKTLTDLYKSGKIVLPDKSGNKNPFFGKTHNDETRKKLSVNKGRMWVNNGEKNKFLKNGEEIPIGYKKGRLDWKTDKQKITQMPN
jgi:group I intron endonuclease